MTTRDEKDTGIPLEDDHRQTCVDCGKESPHTQTNYTLISTQHGWRLSRSIDAAGRRIVKWRCPECWKKHKAATRGSMPPHR